MPAHQHTAWASGSRKAPPSGRRRKPQTPWTRTKRKVKRHFDHHPGQALAAMILLGLVAIICLIIGLFAENLLYFLAAGLSSLGAVAAARTQHLAQQRQEQSTRIPKPPRTRPAGGEKPPTETSSEQRSDVVTCTRTGKQVWPKDDCPCPEKHVTSAKGVKWFGLPLGSPIVLRKKNAQGPSKPPMTSRAKPPA